MKTVIHRFSIFTVSVFACLLLGSWSGGPSPECANDSLAIIRVVKPINELFNIRPAMFVSKGVGKIDQVRVTDTENLDSDLVLKQTLSDFISNGYTIQTATESVGDGLRLNTYYLKKKVI